MSSNELFYADLPRDAVLVEGEDAGSFLHSQLAQDIASLKVGEYVHSLLLEPTGHIHSIVRVIRHQEHLYSLDLEEGMAKDLVTRLQRFVLRSRVTLTVSDWKVRAFRGNAVSTLVSENAQLCELPWSAGDAADQVGPENSLLQVGEETEVGHIDRWRVDAGWPHMMSDILVGDIPATCGVLSELVSFTKGCYPGQELVERMDSRGTSAPIVLRLIDKDGYGVGARVEENAKSVGTITSIGFTKAIARVSRDSTIGEPLR